MLVSKGLELALSPGVEDPVADAGPGLLGIILGLVPVGLDLLDEAVLGGLSLAGGLGASGLQEGAQVGAVPALVGGDDIVVPVLLDQRLEVLAVRGRRVRDVVVREPALELGLMPLVVDCETGILSASNDGDEDENDEGCIIPALVPGNQLLAAAPPTASAAVKAVKRCLMVD